MNTAIRDLIKSKAHELGFSDCGITKADFLREEEPWLSQWLAKGYHAGMDYMTKNTGKRLDPRELVENAKSVIVVLYNYCPADYAFQHKDYKISRYAQGEDYHHVIKEKLREIVKLIQEYDAPAYSRAFTDSAPVLERAWATRAGLGWIGKNTMLITKKAGSWFFIGEIITTLELPPDEPFGGNYCGDCSRCLDACPTTAITKPFVIDANRCISYLTIENKGVIHDSLKGEYDHWIFGCDICQEVCPWNRFSFPHTEPLFEPSHEIKEMNKTDWEDLDRERFSAIFRKSAVKRTKYEGLKRNIDFLKHNSANPKAI